MSTVASASRRSGRVTLRASPTAIGRPTSSTMTSTIGIVRPSPRGQPRPIDPARGIRRRVDRRRQPAAAPSRRTGRARRSGARIREPARPRPRLDRARSARSRSHPSIGRRRPSAPIRTKLDLAPGELVAELEHRPSQLSRSDGVANLGQHAAGDVAQSVQGRVLVEPAQHHEQRRRRRRPRSRARAPQTRRSVCRRGSAAAWPAAS